MTRHVLKNGHQKDTCYDEIGIFSSNVDLSGFDSEVLQKGGSKYMNT